MNPMTQISENHPLWISQKYNKDEYEHQLTKITEVTKESTKVMYVSEKHTIEFYDVSTLFGKITHLFYRILGSLGFNNPFDIVKVNYELLKLFKYGVSQHFFNEKTVQNLAENLKTHLILKKRGKADQVVIDAISDILTQTAREENRLPASATPLMRNLTSTLQTFYQTHLTKLFHKQTRLFEQDMEIIKYNKGCILAEQDSMQAIQEVSGAIEKGLSELLEKGISEVLKNKENPDFDEFEFQRLNRKKCDDAILKAINENPRKIAWVFQLFHIYAKRVDELIRNGEFETADLFCDQLFWMSTALEYYDENESVRRIIEQFQGDEQEILGTVVNVYHTMGKLSFEAQKYREAESYLSRANWFSDRMIENSNFLEWNLELCEVHLKYAMQLEKEGTLIEAANQYHEIAVILADVTDRILVGGPLIEEAFCQKDFKAISDHFEMLHKAFYPTKTSIKDLSPETIEKVLLPLMEMCQKFNQARFLHVQRTVSNCGYEVVKQLWEQGIAARTSEKTSEKSDQLFLQIYNSLLTQQLSENKQAEAINTFKTAVCIIFTGWGSSFKACRALLLMNPASELSKEQQKNFYQALLNETGRAGVLSNMGRDFNAMLEDIEPKTIESVINKQKHLIKDLLFRRSSNIPSQINEEFVSKAINLLIKEGFYVSPLYGLTNDRIYGQAAFAYELWQKDGSERTLESIEKEIHSDFEKAKSNPDYYIDRNLPLYEVIDFNEIATECNISIEELLKDRIEFFGRRHKETGVKDLILKIDGNLVRVNHINIDLFNSSQILSFDLSSKLNLNVSLLDEKIILSANYDNGKHLKVTIENYPWARAKSIPILFNAAF